MTRIDHERNGRPPAEDDGALEAERPIERVRPVRVPGAVAGGRRAEPPPNGDDAGNRGRRITDRWQSVRLRLGDGEGARGDAAARPVPPAEGEDPGLRRYRLPVGVLGAGLATAAVVAALAAGDDGNGASTPPPLDRTPPTRSAPSFVPLTAGPGAGHATAAARLTGSGGTLKLTVHANVPGRPYLVALMGPHGGKGVMGAKRGAA